MTVIGSPALSLVGPRWTMPTPRLYLPMSTMRSWRSGGLGGAFFRTLSISALVMSNAIVGAAPTWAVGAAPFWANATVCHAGHASKTNRTLPMSRFMVFLLCCTSWSGWRDYTGKEHGDE